MHPQDYFYFLAHSALGRYMQTSQWAFAIVEMVHLLALAALGGSVLLTDLRLMGFILKDQSAEMVGRQLGRILLISLTVMILSGIGLLSEEAMKCYFSPAFRWKMALLVASVIFYFTAHRWAVRRARIRVTRFSERVAALISMSLWLGVGIAGRVIGLL
ncbi:DUF6644 family protein [Silvibacterium sp.]|uniref:DUF6644 family protein n=1 Tax=Silvibacterium sp. TaxID=1964179 RepID=UPI0039E66EBF